MTARVAAPQPFDVCGPLPTGVTVLEASAGTGKTFTIAALAARYVAEGTPLDQILLVTFTRMATGELRDRVRERLVHTEQGLARSLAGALPTDGDEVVALLARGSRAEVRERHHRLAQRDRPLRRGDDRDDARLLPGGARRPRDRRRRRDRHDVRRGSRRPRRGGRRRPLRAALPPPRRAAVHARRGAATSRAIAVDNPAARIEPDAAPEHSIAAMRVRFAHVVREEFERPQAAHGADHLRRPAHAPATRR